MMSYPRATVISVALQHSYPELDKGKNKFSVSFICNMKDKGRFP